MIIHETAFLRTLFVPCSVSLRISLIFPLFINKEIPNQYQFITRARSNFFRISGLPKECSTERGLRQRCLNPCPESTFSFSFPHFFAADIVGK